jgi:hypothetical protein
MSDFETWRTSATESRRYTGSTPAEAVAAGHADSGIGSLDGFTAWLRERGLVPFHTGRQWVLRIPAADIDVTKLTDELTPGTGSKY